MTAPEHTRSAAQTRFLITVLLKCVADLRHDLRFHTAEAKAKATPKTKAK